ncbi:MAG: hypothetical protein LBF24_03305 [Puniceicoccales bacterium]|jgi:phosphoglucosamine mutase|nr:hypothetical protein [Puniceicoccales bacterium]
MVARKFFGTDGIRGPWGSKAICPSFFRAIGWAFGNFLLRRGGTKFFLGQDGRSSGDALQAALIEGLPKRISPLLGGVLPSPAISFAARFFAADGAVAITASHNSSEDNGIKFFDGQGRKWSERDEADLEELICSKLCSGLEWGSNSTRAAVDCHEEALVAYRSHWRNILPSNCLHGKKIVLDTANGSFSAIGADLLTSLGAEVISMANRPSGRNINLGCGSEHPNSLCEFVRCTGSDWGLAVDGDGDRAVVCDRTGIPLPGEHLFARVALYFRKIGILTPVVTTAIANGALDRHLASFQVPVLRVAVGDRNVAEAMELHGSHFGGEPSGHFLWTGAGPTADGLLAGALFFSTFSGAPLDVPWQFPLRPTASENIALKKIFPLERAHRFGEMQKKAENALNSNGRVLARYSGTESKLRLIVEAVDGRMASHWLKELRAAFLLDLADEGY